MSRTGIAALPEDVLRGILHPIARDYLQEEDGLRQCRKLAEALPCLSSLTLPRASLGQITEKNLSWEEMMWILPTQPSAALLDVSVPRERPRNRAVCGLSLTEQHFVHTWKGLVKEIKVECNEEVEAVVKMSEDGRGQRQLVLKLLPFYGDDAATFPIDRIVQHLQPLVHGLLQQGCANLQCLRLSVDMIPCLKPLGKLPLRHLEIGIGRRSMAQLTDLMAALSQCTTLEYLLISAAGHTYHKEVSLPDLCLYQTSNLKHVHLLACFPEGKLCLPPGCRLRLDQVWTSPCWESKWRSENGRELLGCIPALCIGFTGDYRLTSSSFHDFTALQYLQLVYAPYLKDLAVLQGIPHVEVKMSHSGGALVHSAGSWQSLQIKGHSAYHISFTDIEGFVRENPRYLFETYRATKDWRSMSSALQSASQKQGVACFPNKPDAVVKRVCTDRNVAESTSYPSPKELVTMDEFWPKHDMQSCSESRAPIPTGKAGVSECMCMLHQKTVLGRTTWLMHKWKPIYAVSAIACILLFCGGSSGEIPLLGVK